MIAWDSRLKSFNMSQHMHNNKPQAIDSRGPIQPKLTSDDFISPNGIRETNTAYILPDGVNNGVPIPKAAFDEEGEIDLSKLTGDQAANYIRHLGIPLMVIPRGKR